MKYLYKKIYEAINTGIQNALALDDEDVSIIYQHKKIDNSINLMDYYVTEFVTESLNSPEDLKKAYYNIVQYYKKTLHTYKISSFNDLINIFYKIKSIKLYKRPNLNWINMSGIVSLIFKDNTELPFNQYDKSMSKKVEFIKIYVPDNTLFILQDTNEHHEIILHKHLLINDNNGYYYNYNNYNVENIKNSEIFNGYNINQSIKDAICQEPIESKKKSPFSYINDINKHTTNYEAYIPSIWELQFIYKNADIINLIILTISEKTGEYIIPLLNIKEQDCILSSTISNGHIYCMSAIYETQYNGFKRVKSVLPEINIYDNAPSGLILPLFHKK